MNLVAINRHVTHPHTQHRARSCPSRSQAAPWRSRTPCGWAKLTLPQALIAESFGLVDVWNLPEKRWSPCMTTLGREVCKVLDEEDERED